MSKGEFKMQNAKCKTEGCSKSSSEQPTLNLQAAKTETSAEPFITKELVAQRLCVTPETVRRWASDGRLPSHHFGRRLRFKWSEVEAALMNQK